MTNFPGNDGLTPWSTKSEYEALRGADWTASSNLPQADDLSMSSAWQLDSPDAADAAMTGADETFVYRRIAHPNARALEKKLATLHSAQGAVVTAQGMSAIAALALATLQPESSVWLGNELYGETSQLFTKHMSRWNVATRIFDPCNAAHLAELSANKVDLVFVETITNPRLRVPDLQAVAEATHAAGARVAVDNTFATHLLCKPLDFGADFVVESLGKQVNGHSDSMLGLICGKDELKMAEVRSTVKTFGLTSSPLDCYMTHRGLMTLAVRMARACANSLALACELERCGAVSSVDYPGLATHKEHGLATRQLSGGYGWMLSFRIAPDRPSVEKLMAALRPDIRFVPSLGDVTTTLSHPKSTSHRSASTESLAELGIDEGTIRVSCGIEPTAWLVERFRNALS